MPLDRVVSFEALVQKSNLFQVPKKMRWAFKMEPTQMLSVEIRAPRVAFGTHSFLAKMRKDGRIQIPKLTCALINEEPSLVGALVDVTIRPVYVSSE